MRHCEIIDQLSLDMMLHEKVYHHITRSLIVRVECEITAAIYRGREEDQKLMQRLQLHQHPQQENDLCIAWSAVPERIFIPFAILSTPEPRIELFSGDMRNALRDEKGDLPFLRLWFPLYDAVLRSPWYDKIKYFHKRRFVDAVFSAAGNVIRYYTESEKSSQVNIVTKATIKLVKEYGKQIHELHKTI